MTNEDCVFCRIVQGEIPAQKIFEDDNLLAFRDIRPQCPVHLLLIPKRHITSLASAEETDAALLGQMLLKAHALASVEGSREGFRIVINTGYIGQQEVPHLHVHVLGGSVPLGPILSGI